MKFLIINGKLARMSNGDFITVPDNYNNEPLTINGKLLTVGGAIVGKNFTGEVQLATPQNVIAYGATVTWDPVKNATSYAMLADGNEIGILETGATDDGFRIAVDLTALPGWSSLSSGSHNITIVAKANGFKDSAPSTAVSVEKATAPKTLEESTWAEIAQVSANKSWDAMGWKVGDTKTITLNGTVGTVAFNNYQCKVYILGFDHNADKEGQGISFGMLEGMDGKQLCLVDGNCNYTTSSATAFTMNTSNVNNGGWKNCHLRKTILGSTDVANGNATSAAITNPASGTLMAALPSDLRTVLKPITKYTNNVGQSTVASAITPTVDYLPLLSEYEVSKTTARANTNEATYQAQYQYYANGKSKVKYQHNAVSNVVYWWLRSPGASNSYSFCYVYSNGNIFINFAANYSFGVAPVFLV